MINPAIKELKMHMNTHSLNQHQLAFRINLPTSRISQILTQKRRFTIETDIKLCKLFSLKPLHFFNIQTEHELKIATQKYKTSLDNIINI